MGSKNSKPKEKLRKKDVKELAECTKFSETELVSLYEQFKRISATKTDDGLIDLHELMSALDLKSEDFAGRIFAAFDHNGDGNISFTEFVTGISVFSHGTVEEKLALSFKIYDIDNNGCISKEELLFILRATVFGLLDMTEEHLQQLVASTFEETDQNGDGVISFEEYRAMVLNHPQILKNFQLDPLAIHNLTTSGEGSAAATPDSSGGAGPSSPR